MKKNLFLLLIFSFIAISCSNKSSNKTNFSSENSKLPVIKINSESGKNDFVTKPRAAVVVENLLHWNLIDPKDLKNGNITDPEYENCTISVINSEKTTELSEIEAKVKVRGNWTTNYDKKPLRIKFSEKQNILGLHEGKEFKNWVLLASYKDWSFMRDVTALTFSRLFSNNYVSDILPVEVYINNKYWGVYLLAELQEINEDRINITKVKADYTGNDIGYLIEYDGYAEREDINNQFNIKYSDISDKKVNLKDINGNKVTEYVNCYTIKNDINDINQKLFIEKYMNNLWKICYEAAYNNAFYEFDENYDLKLCSDTKMTSYDCISKIIDVQSLVDTYIVCEVACDPDLYWSSFFMDIDFGPEGNKKLKFEAPWDFDSAFGNKRHCKTGNGVFAGAVQMDVDFTYTGCGNPWMMIFINCDWFKDMIRSQWKNIKKNKIQQKLVKQIDTVINEKAYQEAFYRDQNRWHNIGMPWVFGEELNEKTANCKTQKEAALYLKNWIEKRFEALNEIWK